MNGVRESSSNESKGTQAIGVLSRRHQLTAGAITLCCLLLIATYWISEFERRGKLINIDRQFNTGAIELKIDLNQADWPELTLLPEISETMARRVVEFREANGRFRSLDEVQRVKGIGPRTFVRIKPFLAPIPPINATAERQ